MEQIDYYLINSLNFTSYESHQITYYAQNCAGVFYTYETADGYISFVYVEKIGDGQGLVKRGDVDEQDVTHYQYSNGIGFGELN